MYYSAELRAKNAPRNKYLEDILDPMLIENPDLFFSTLDERIFKCATDIFGAESKPLEILAITKKNREYDFSTDLTGVISNGVNYVDENEGIYILKKLAIELATVASRDIDYFSEVGLTGFWESLERAGMTHEQIAVYIEDY